MNSNRLENAGRRMLCAVFFIARQSRCNQICELLRAENRFLGSGLLNRLSGFHGKALFSEIFKNLGHLGSIGAGNPFCRRFSRARVHAHVQWTVETERKSALRVIDLRAGDSDIKKNAVDFINADLCQFLFHEGKRSMDNLKPQIFDLCRGLNGVSVKRDQAPLRREFFQYQARVPSTAESTVDIDTIRIGYQESGRLFSKYRAMNQDFCLHRKLPYF